MTLPHWILLMKAKRLIATAPILPIKKEYSIPDFNPEYRFYLYCVDYNQRQQMERMQADVNMIGFVTLVTAFKVW